MRLMTNIRQENPIPINQQFHKRMKRKRKRRRRRRVLKKKAGKKSQPCRFPNIPEEIIVEILSRLSRSSLSRCTCVSKQWRSLVSNIIPKITRRKMVLVHSSFRSGTPTLHSIDEESHVKQVSSPWENSISSYPPAFFGSCNGLVLVNIKDDLFLWNPVTRYFKKVLSYNILKIFHYRVVSGLCYDSLSDEYKALVALAHDSPYGGEFVMVGSFRNKDWRMVPFSYRIGTVESGPVVNGNLHWYGSKKNSSIFLPGHQIIYFNPHRNKFKKVPMPEPKADGDTILGLGVLDGRLSMVRHDNPRNYECHRVEVLAMKEYGIIESWTILFIISNLTLTCLDTMKPLYYTKDGEALMDVLSCCNGTGILAYNLEENFHREISVQPDQCDVSSIEYEESLTTPIDYNWEEDELRGEATYKEFCYGSPLKYQKTVDGYWESSYIDDEDHELQNSVEDDQSETDEE